MEIYVAVSKDFTDFYCELLGLLFKLNSGEVSIVRWFMRVYYSGDWEYNKAREGYILDEDMMGDLLRKTRLKRGTARLYLYSLNRKGVIDCTLKSKRVNIIHGLYKSILVDPGEREIVIKVGVDG